MGKKTYIWILDDPAVASLPPGWWLLRVLLHRWTVIAQARTRRTWVRSHGWGPWHIRTPPLVTSLIGISLELVEDNSSFFLLQSIYCPWCMLTHSKEWNGYVAHHRDRQVLADTPERQERQERPRLENQQTDAGEPRGGFHTGMIQPDLPSGKLT